MHFAEAQTLLAQGAMLTRPALGRRFVLVRDGQTRLGAFIGETRLASSRPYTLTEVDRAATDWTRYEHIRPDDWDGCDAG